MKTHRLLAHGCPFTRTSSSATWKWRAVGCEMSSLETVPSVGMLAQKYSCCPPVSVLAWLLSGHSNQHKKNAGPSYCASLPSVLTVHLICWTGKILLVSMQCYGNKRRKCIQICRGVSWLDEVWLSSERLMWTQTNSGTLIPRWSWKWFI